MHISSLKRYHVLYLITYWFNNIYLQKPETGSAFCEHATKRKRKKRHNRTSRALPLRLSHKEHNVLLQEQAVACPHPFPEMPACPDLRAQTFLLEKGLRPWTLIRKVPEEKNWRQHAGFTVVSSFSSWKRDGKALVKSPGECVTILQFQTTCW